MNIGPVLQLWYDIIFQKASWQPKAQVFLLWSRRCLSSRTCFFSPPWFYTAFRLFLFYFKDIVATFSILLSNSARQRQIPFYPHFSYSTEPNGTLMRIILLYLSSKSGSCFQLMCLVLPASWISQTKRLCTKRKRKHHLLFDSLWLANGLLLFLTAFAFDQQGWLNNMKGEEYWSFNICMSVFF